MLRALEEIRVHHPAGTVAIVGHGGSLRAVICAALDAPVDSKYVEPNYEAQQPSLYYSLVAPLARLFPRTVLTQLRVWRFASVLFALIAMAGLWRDLGREAEARAAAAAASAGSGP